VLGGGGLVGAPGETAGAGAPGDVTGGGVVVAPGEVTGGVVAPGDVTGVLPGEVAGVPPVIPLSVRPSRGAPTRLRSPWPLPLQLWVRLLS